MRIISKFHDYYDSVQSYGYDPNITYIRNLTEINNKEKEYENIYKDFSPFFKNVGSEYNWNAEVYFDVVGMIVFCGKIYPYIGMLQKDYKFLFFYNSLELIDYVIKNFVKKQLKHFFRKRLFYKTNHAESIQNFFKYKGTPIDLNFHFSVGSPIINIIKYKKIEINPVLKYIEFYKVIDTFTAYQELSMFISGVMGGQSPPMIEIDDKTRLEKHGFDKFSFRKEKEK